MAVERYKDDDMPQSFTGGPQVYERLACGDPGRLWPHFGWVAPWGCSGRLAGHASTFASFAGLHWGKGSGVETAPPTSTALPQRVVSGEKNKTRRKWWSPKSEKTLHQRWGRFLTPKMNPCLDSLPKLNKAVCSAVPDSGPVLPTRKSEIQDCATRDYFRGVF